MARDYVKKAYKNRYTHGYANADTYAELTGSSSAKHAKNYKEGKYYPTEDTSRILPRFHEDESVKKYIKRNKKEVLEYQDKGKYNRSAILANERAKRSQKAGGLSSTQKREIELANEMYDRGKAGWFDSKKKKRG